MINILHADWQNDGVHIIIMGSVAESRVGGQEFESGSSQINYINLILVAS